MSEHTFPGPSEPELDEQRREDRPNHEREEHPGVGNEEKLPSADPLDEVCRPWEDFLSTTTSKQTRGTLTQGHDEIEDLQTAVDRGLDCSAPNADFLERSSARRNP